MVATVRGLAIALVGSLSLLACPGPPKHPEISPAWVGSNLEPMVVDWEPDQRQSLEIAMRAGVAVVEYNEKGFRLLRDCKVDGKYGFSGAVRKERVWHWDSADDLRANLPLGGLGIAAKLGGEFERGATLDVAIVTVGQLRTTWRIVTSKDLNGQCVGATHIVRGAAVGAFALDKGDKSRVRGALEIFKAGLGAEKRTEQSIRNVDGAFEDCANAKAASEGPPGQCAALVKLELEALSPESAATEAAANAPVTNKETCPPGFVEVQGACAKRTANVVGECTFGEGAACEAACRAGLAKSCARLGYMRLKGTGVAKSPAGAAEAFAASCKGEFGDGCTVLGDLVADGAPGVPKNATEALKIYGVGCDLGSADACQRFGARVLGGMGFQKDPALAARAMVRGCNGGNKDACSDLGLLYLGGSPPFRKELPRAASLFKLACDGLSAVGCANLAYMFEFGQGVQADLRLAAQLYGKGCALHPTECLWLGALHLTGRVPGSPASEKKAVELWKQACQAESVPACAILKAYAEPRITLNMEIAQAYVNLWEGTCKENLARDCTGLAVMLIAGGRAPDGERVLVRACKLGDPLACDLGKRPHN